MSDDVLFKKYVKNYIIGGSIALLLTLCAFGLVLGNALAGVIGGTALLGLAAAQAIIQLYFFLHLGEERKPYWKNFTFVFTILTIFIIVGGSIWIVSRMNYNMMMTPEEMTQFMQDRSEEGF